MKTFLGVRSCFFFMRWSRRRAAWAVLIKLLYHSCWCNGRFHLNHQAHSWLTQYSSSWLVVKGRKFVRGILLTNASPYCVLVYFKNQGVLLLNCSFAKKFWFSDLSITFASAFYRGNFPESLLRECTLWSTNSSSFWLKWVFHGAVLAFSFLGRVTARRDAYLTVWSFLTPRCFLVVFFSGKFCFYCVSSTP